ncbi:MAG: glucuronyl hydrolase [Ignavibacteriae bacterium]|nr:MAG: glucuronyl hydrolase [Ignavibacteriota bacterium]
MFFSAVMIIAFSSKFNAQSHPHHEEPIKNVIIETLDFAVQQSLQMARSLQNQPGVLPRTTDQFGKLKTCKPDWWVSGFFPGELWYLYEYSGNKELKKWARAYTGRVEEQQYTCTSHDVGFIINCSFGNGFRIMHDTAYNNVLRTAAHSLFTRFNSRIGCIRSWDYAEWSKQWQYPVIIDNMMNLELLMIAAREFHEPDLSDGAVRHATTTLKNHFRTDYSSYHVVSYDTLTGMPELKQTSQGYADSSAWARGQAWGLYGFTMMYRFTKDSGYLVQAKHIADFIIHHPRFPEDKIPFWDFDAPNIPHCLHDASAGSIICSALIELSQYVESNASHEYLAIAEKQIRVLSSQQYRNAFGCNGNFILNHCVGHMPNNSEVDVPLIYADYYFVEALMRYKKLNKF